MKILLLGLCGLLLLAGYGLLQASDEADMIRLPIPVQDSNTSIEEALISRRSVREFSSEPMTIREVSQLLWAAQGSIGEFRTAPSAGALYPMEVYVVCGNVEGLPAGVYRYRPDKHGLVKSVDGDKRAELSEAAMGQASVRNAAIDLIIAGVYERTTGKYDRPVRDKRIGASYPSGVGYVHMEAGHVAQNVYLQSVSLGLGTVTIGAFYQGQVKAAAELRDDERPLYIMPVGRKLK